MQSNAKLVSGQIQGGESVSFFYNKRQQTQRQNKSTVAIFLIQLIFTQTGNHLMTVMIVRKVERLILGCVWQSSEKVVDENYKIKRYFTYLLIIKQLKSNKKISTHSINNKSRIWWDGVAFFPETSNFFLKRVLASKQNNHIYSVK